MFNYSNSTRTPVETECLKISKMKFLSVITGVNAIYLANMTPVINNTQLTRLHKQKV